jgi:hypothetical protein
MPSAPRERKPALAILAVLLIAGGALAAGALVVRSGQRVGAVEITRAVSPGQQIPAGAVQEVQVPADTAVKYVSWQFAGQVPQYFATTAIPAGTLLNSGMITKTLALPNGDAEVGLALKDGQVPANLQDGDQVSVYSTQATTGGGCPGKAGAILAHGSVVDISQAGTGANFTDVVIAMDPETAGAVACNTANGTAALAIIPGGDAGAGNATSTPGGAGTGNGAG